MDPLCQTQSLAYLRGLGLKGYRFALITFEQEVFELGHLKKSEIRSELEREGILWFPLRYHKRFPMIATAWDCLLGIITGMYLSIRYRPQVVHTRASIAAAMGLVLSKLTGMKFLYDADSRLSEEYAGTGYWQRSSPAYRLVSWVEDASRRHAHAVIVLSEKLRHDFIENFGVTVPVTVIPCCVDPDRFNFDAQARARRRSEAGFGDDKILIYVGKNGPRYLIRELMEFFSVAVEQAGRMKLLILTGDSPDVFQRIAETIGLDQELFKIMHARHKDVMEWLTAADAGLAFIKTTECERGSSPIKIGEYLASGLPVVLTSEIGDFSDLIESERVGVVIRDHSRDEYIIGINQLLSLWSEGEQVKSRCRKAALDHVSLNDIGLKRYADVYQSMLNH